MLWPVRRFLHLVTAFVVPVLLALTLGVAARSPAVADEGAHRVIVLLDVKDAIGPATAEYLHRGITAAAARGASLIVLRMDTPGGLATSMREIIQDILASPIPVVTYVSPGGARAASAGTYILYASHIAAMTPGTNLGAATPVSLGGGSQPLPALPGDGADKTKSTDKSDEAPANAISTDTETAKVVNDAVAYIRGLAELRGRNADWAEQAVRQAASLPASDALKQGVIDIIAPDLDNLLVQLDGRHVQIAGTTVTLQTKGAEVVAIEPDWRAQLLGVITNPNIAYILMLAGIGGLILEMTTPGAIFPGTVGAISLIIGLFALNLLPVNYAGVGLVLLGIVLLVAEAFIPSFGVLGVGGMVAFALGSVFMFNSDAPGFALSLPVVFTATAVVAVLLAIMLAAVVRAHRRRVVIGGSTMIGAAGEVLIWSGGEGQIHVHGERWQARSAAPLAPGERVRVIDRDGLALTVEPERK